MKVTLILPFTVVSFLFTACDQKSAQITSSSPVPSSSPAQAVEPPSDSGVISPSVADASPQEQAAPSPAPSVAADSRPVFKSEAATQAANQYLDSYRALVNDLSAKPQLPTGSSEATMNYLRSYTQNIARESAEVANRQRQVESQLTPDERKRLRQYQKSLEQQGQDQ